MKNSFNYTYKWAAHHIYPFGGAKFAWKKRKLKWKKSSNVFYFIYEKKHSNYNDFKTNDTTLCYIIPFTSLV